MYENTVHLRPTHPLEVSLLHPKSKGVFRLRVGLLSLASKRHPSDGPFHFWRNGSLHRSRRWHCPQGVLPARSAFQPIHFGREEGVERTLLRVACQSETFLASPWQGDASIRFVGHIGCQSDFDELVSMVSRPVDRGFGRMAEPSRSFHPVKSRFLSDGRD